MEDPVPLQELAKSPHRYLLEDTCLTSLTFPQDMTEAEGKLMQEHIAYWKDFADRRIAVIFGPVVDPKGVVRFGSPTLLPML